MNTLQTVKALSDLAAAAAFAPVTAKVVEKKSFSSIYYDEDIKAVIIEFTANEIFLLSSFKTPFQITEGRYYEAANGMIFGPMHRVEHHMYDPEWKWVCINSGGLEAAVWKDNGDFGHRTEFNLVREIPKFEGF